MMRRRVTASALVLIIVFGTGSAFLLRKVDQLRPQATLKDVLYISSPSLLKRLSLGYHGLVAAIYWTRAVQYYGDRHRSRGGDYTLLWPLLNITTQLDPRLVPAYQFGGTF